MIIYKSSFLSEASFNYFSKFLIRELRNTDTKVSFNKNGLVIISNDTKVISKVEKMVMDFKKKNCILNEREKMDHLYSLVLNNKRAISSYKNQKNVSLEELETTHTIALIENIKRERKRKRD